jgi:hypothetical protein
MTLNLLAVVRPKVTEINSVLIQSGENTLDSLLR